MISKINVLSLFDGISVARYALDLAGIAVDKYYSSEIEEYAIQVSNKNYPDIIRLGDIKTLTPPRMNVLIYLLVVVRVRICQLVKIIARA